MATSEGEHMTDTSACPKCDDDGYLDESTLTKPVFCDCPIGVAKSKERQ